LLRQGQQNILLSNVTFKYTRKFLLGFYELENVLSESKFCLVVNHHGLCNNPCTHKPSLLKNNENQRTVGFGYLTKIRMKEPLVLGI
jgi:hypothetical protein